MNFSLGLDWNKLGHNLLANGITLAVLGGAFYGLSRLGYTPHFCTPSESRRSTDRAVSPPPTQEEDESE